MKIVAPIKGKTIDIYNRNQKIDQIGKLQKELKFLEIGMHRVKTKLQKLQQDSTLTLPMNMVGLRTKQFVD